MTAGADTILEQIRAIRSDRSTISDEQQWLINHLDDARLRTLLPDVSIVGLHILSALQLGERTGIELASELTVTRGGITRAVKKLLQTNLAVAGQHATDRKRIFYSLTADGRTVAALHDQMHAAMTQQLTQHLQANYTPAELATISRFLNDLQTYERHLPQA